MIVTKLDSRRNALFVWRHAHKELYTEIDIPDQSAGLAWSFYWPETKLLFLKGSSGLVPYRLSKHYSDLSASRDTPLLGPGTREVKKINTHTIVATEFNSKSWKFCFYFVTDNLAPRLFYSLNEVPHYWTVTKDFLFVVAGGELRLVELASLETLKTIGAKKPGSTSYWPGFWSATLHKNTDDMWLGSNEGRFSIASTTSGHEQMASELHRTLSIQE